MLAGQGMGVWVMNHSIIFYHCGITAAALQIKRVRGFPEPPRHPGRANGCVPRGGAHCAHCLAEQVQVALLVLTRLSNSAMNINMHAPTQRPDVATALHAEFGKQNEC